MVSQLIMKFKDYINEKILYVKTTNFEVLKDKKLTLELRKLDHRGLSGGFGAVLNYPEENPSKIVIAYDNKKPIGWISVGTKDKTQNIFVNPDYRTSKMPNYKIATTLKNKIYKRK